MIYKDGCFGASKGRLAEVIMVTTKILATMLGMLGPLYIPNIYIYIYISLLGGGSLTSE